MGCGYLEVCISVKRECEKRMESDRNKKRMSAGLLAVGCCLTLFAGCGQKQPEARTVPETVTVSYYKGNSLIGRETVPEGGIPSREILIDGKIQGWQTEKGETVRPDLQPVYEDTVYYVEEYPELSNFVPFLFPEKDGLLNPAGPLNGEQLTAALRALLPPGEEDKTDFSRFPSGGRTVNGETLRDVLCRFFPEKQVEAVVTVPEKAPVPRWYFAEKMEELLGRSPETGVTDVTFPSVPGDLHGNDPHFLNLLMAFTRYRETENGTSWEEALPEGTYPPGFFLLDGCLYEADSKGKLLRDTEQDCFMFDHDGRYTCGDPETDTMVRNLTETICEDSPAGSRMDHLYKAFCYCRDQFEYLRKSLHARGDTSWVLPAGKEMLEKGRGNCYSYAGAFCLLARNLGYEAYGVSGTIYLEKVPHGWVRLYDDDGTAYYCDPEMAYLEKRGTRQNWGEDMFMIPMENVGDWYYNSLGYW